MHSPQNACAPRKAIAEAFSEVLETMFFSSPMDAGSEGALGDAPVTASLLVTSDQTSCPPRSGEFTISMPLETARCVGAGFLGCDESEVADPEAGEVLCELANMICGSVLSRLDSETIYHLSHPALTPPRQTDPLTTTTQWFQLENGFARTTFTLQAAL